MVAKSAKSLPAGPSERNMRHGDLKPENILNFGNKGTLGTLKISDLGLAKEHDEKTAMRMDTTKTIHGTIRYEAPEVHKLINHERARSRRYDTWSMGCIIFESIIWLLYGKGGLNKFWKNEESIISPKKDSLYFTTIGHPPTAARLSDVISDWMKKIMQQEDQERQGSRTMIKDLLLLVKDKLLVVNLEPNAGSTRIYANTLYDEMEAIYNEALKNPKYLFSGTRRPIPTNTRQVYKTHGSSIHLAPPAVVSQPPMVAHS